MCRLNVNYRRSQVDIIKKGSLILILACLVLISPILDKAHGSETLSQPEFATEYDLLDFGINVMAADDDHIWASGDYGRVLYKSRDYGDTWKMVKIFDKKIKAIHITSEDILLVSISDGRWLEDCNSQILRSDNGGKSFKKVLDLESGAALAWNIASDEDGYIFISEYGYKSLPDNSRRIYRSSDSGLNWKKVYEPKEAEGYHNHVISIDENNNNIIYQVIGDDDKKILESRDRGDTWKQILHGYHPTSQLQFGDNILWGLDGAPESGIIRYNTKTEKLDYSFKTPSPLKGSIYDMLYVNDIIYAGLLSYSGPDDDWDGSIFISRDQGLTWENFAIWPKYNEDSGIGFYKFTSQGDYGFIHAELPVIKNGKIENYRGTLRFKLLNIPKKTTPFKDPVQEPLINYLFKDLFKWLLP